MILPNDQATVHFMLAHYVLQAFQNNALLRMTEGTFYIIHYELLGRFPELSLTTEDTKEIWIDAIQSLIDGGALYSQHMPDDITEQCHTLLTDMFVKAVYAIELK